MRFLLLLVTVILLTSCKNVVDQKNSVLYLKTDFVLDNRLNTVNAAGIKERVIELSEEYYMVDPISKKERLEHTNSYLYDKNGTAKVHTYTISDGSSVSTDLIYSYDDRGRVVKVTGTKKAYIGHIINETNITYDTTSDKVLQVVESTTRPRSSRVVNSIMNYSYNDSGSTIEERIKTRDGMEYIFRYSLNENGMVKRFSNLIEPATCISNTYYEYGENGLLSSKTEHEYKYRSNFDTTDFFTVNTLVTYKLDSVGNWTEAVYEQKGMKYRVSKNQTYIKRRKITYQ